MYALQILAQSIKYCDSSDTLNINISRSCVYIWSKYNKFYFILFLYVIEFILKKWL